MLQEANLILVCKLLRVQNYLLFNTMLIVNVNQSKLYMFKVQKHSSSKFSRAEVLFKSQIKTQTVLKYQTNVVISHNIPDMILISIWQYHNQITILIVFLA